ncbi:Arm DNA-binding domain-containing protein [Methylococcus sp. EFPC2]|uniref:Arm DNA-binding domain-containing protein n=1 Tax=Methylococcus sp. EFPC2 TaxID=2812648 RepID=UPI0019676AAF|nr:Arm DNA-binding domain-containing protein [Methylococcus sp. EFPC2]QSA97062.1 DUF4102 domain-containing protein [Methylococcus sp. EFPC2]
MPLKDVEIKAAKPGAKPLRMFDGGGMYLEVMPDEAKYWRLKYRYAGKEKRLAFGVYPEVSLKAARELRDKARELLRQGVDPGEHRKTVKTA